MESFPDTSTKFVDAAGNTDFEALWDDLLGVNSKLEKKAKRSYVKQFFVNLFVRQF